MSIIETGKFNPYRASGSAMFSTFRRFFLGKKFPDMYTRVICNLGIISFIYNFGWSLMVLLLLDFGTSLPKYEEWDILFNSYGEKYGIFDIHFSFHTYVVCVLFFSAIMLLGIIFVWRQKRSGYFMVIGSQVFLIAAPLLLLGVLYFQHEIKVFEWGMASLLALLFLIGYFVKKKK